MRNRKPLVELERSSPTYEGLATKYVLYTTEVGGVVGEEYHRLATVF